MANIERKSEFAKNSNKSEEEIFVEKLSVEQIKKEIHDNENVIDFVCTDNFLGKEIDIFNNSSNPLFLATDVAQWIEYRKTSGGVYDTDSMMALVNNKEKLKIFCRINLYSHPETRISGSYDNNRFSKLSKLCNRWFLTEEGLYEILFKSNKEIAIIFKEKVKTMLRTLRIKNMISNSIGYSFDKMTKEQIIDVIDKAIKDKNILPNEIPSYKNILPESFCNEVDNMTKILKYYGFNKLKPEHVNRIFVERGILSKVDIKVKIIKNDTTYFVSDRYTSSGHAINSVNQKNTKEYSYTKNSIKYNRDRFSDLLIVAGITKENEDELVRIYGGNSRRNKSEDQI